MNSLEFIEKEIKKRIDNISAWGKLLKDDPNDKFSARCLNKYKEELEVLFKIKSELEAWEIVKDEIKVKEVPNYFYPQYCIYLRYMNGSINKEQYERLKKALEVENES